MASETPEEYRHHRRYVVRIGLLYQRRKVRVYTGIIFSILTTAFFLFFAIRPTIVTIAGLLKEINDKRTIAGQLEDKISALNSAQIEYQQVEKNFYLLDEALPINSNLSLLVRQLETLARKHNVTIGSLQFETTTLKGEENKVVKAKKKVEENGQGVDFNIIVAGDYDQLKSFFDALIRLRRLVLVDAFSFQGGDKEGGLVLNLNAKAHYLTEKQ